MGPDHPVADQPRMDPPAGQAGQPQTAHKSHMEPREAKAEKVDMSEVMGGGAGQRGDPTTDHKLREPTLLSIPSQLARHWACSWCLISAQVPINT